METSMNIVGYTAYFSTDEKKWINKIRELAEQNPGDVKIIMEPSGNDGCLYVKMPASWFHLAAKRKRTMTEEQMEAAKERGRMLAAMRKGKGKKNEESEDH